MLYQDFGVNDNLKSSCVTRNITKIKVTAVKFIDNYLYVGIGGDIKVFQIEADHRHKLLFCQNVLKHNNVYGISPCQIRKKAVIYGGKHFRVLPLYPEKYCDDEPLRQVKGWIWHVKWLKDDNLALVMGHNELLLFNSNNKNNSTLISCEEKCILYSGLVIGNDFEKNLVILSGTVYKELLIWAPSFSKSGLTNMIIQRLKGHNGVLFSVNYDKRSQCICSTSDDRTIRVWKICSMEGDAIIKNQVLSVKQWKNCKICEVYSVFGHSARVFRSSMISLNRVISIGEDCFLCVWDAEGKNILKKETHQRGAVCCLDYHEELKLAVTGGADGGVSFWPISTDDNKNSLILSPPIIPARIKIMNNNKIIITGRNTSSLYAYEECWENFFNDDRILNYSLLEVSHCRKFLALATIQGYLIIFHDVGKRNILKIIDERIFNGKIYSLHWLTENLILCCGDEGVLSLWSLLYNKEYKGNLLFDLSMTYQMYLPMCKERWVTSAVIFQQKKAEDSDSSLLVCGDRCGSIHVFQLNNINKNPMQTFSKIHGRLGVSCIYNYCDYILSTGRDGVLRKFAFNKNSKEKCQLTPVSIDKLALPWGAKIINTKYLGILVLGFHEKDLVVWSMQARLALWKFECSGGHREWDFIINSSNNEACFYYLKDKSVNCIFKKFSSLACPPLLDGFHIREINTLKFLTCTKSSDVPFCAAVISGSEDTMIKVSLLSGDTWKPILVLGGHLSSVRCMDILEVENGYLLFTAGGRAQLKIWFISIENDAKSSFEVNGNEIYSYMLKCNWRNALPSIDPETRFMDLSVVHNYENDDLNDVLVSVACSDGQLRTFRYNICMNKLELYSSIEYRRCLLKVINTDYNKIGGKNMLNIITTITTSTDGKIVFWNTFVNEPLYILKVHQSGINSFDYTSININEDNYRIVIASGGDDCSIVISVLSVNDEFLNAYKDKLNELSTNENNTLFKVSSWSSSILHSSQVSGLKIIDNLIITAGVDQRINVLKWGLKQDGSILVNSIFHYISVIADIHGIEVWKKTENIINVCIYGVGMEVISLNKAELYGLNVLSTK